ncbi:hypothetical protein L6452_18009 [Arctium lappa]|uniref:Uncharacterized protein n=1 Tax=Arctium lappa TaxID=4217 RepID=A0ACB9C502_ARCLA|nr:hypothetical protein L6452_18009 [Arctium lappa]
MIDSRKGGGGGGGAWKVLLISSISLLLLSSFSLFFLTRTLEPLANKTQLSSLSFFLSVDTSVVGERIAKEKTQLSTTTPVS